ncbi:WecB/TagA/CpsF family glycosyltransferase [Candidatus Gottesmanbacteria bacterium]|nr:WecB/TagA/CpsF family glycosyltransferase [Candidatus Gottesmanbacteria bacterium]
MEDTIKVLDINITTLPENDILERIEKYIKSVKREAERGKNSGQKPLTIFTPNPEIIMYARSHQWFAEIVNKGQINIPDGAGVVWAVKRKGYPVNGRIAGADLAYKLIRQANKQNVTIGLIGGKVKIALRALECLKEDLPSLKGWAEEGPDIKFEIRNSKFEISYGNWNMDEFIKRVQERNTKVLLVAFGFPKQELFIDQISKKLEDIVIMSVGGTFDYWSGSVKRAPRWMQQNNLEWFYRLLKQPHRIKRHISGSKFFFYSYINK